MHLHDEKPKLTGHLVIELFGPDGKLKDRREVDNLVVDTGLGWWAARGTNTPPNAMSHMALGSGQVAPAPEDVALGSELGRQPLSSQTANGNVTTYAAGFPAGVATGPVTEAGVFNAGAAGTMLNRATFGVVTKAAGDTMTITWSVNQN